MNIHSSLQKSNKAHPLTISLVHFVLCFLLTIEVKQTANAQTFDRVDILKSVADWQVANIDSRDTNWQHCVFYLGLWDYYKFTGDRKYYDLLHRMGEKNDWEIYLNRHFWYFWRPQKYADHQCIGQLYLNIYEEDNKQLYIENTAFIFERFSSEAVRKKNEWWWCDAIFMAAPALTRMYRVTGNSKYLDIMDEMFWETTDLLYSKEDSLYFRDESYFNKKSKNGEKVFWSRGNAWVLAGIARILEDMPDHYKSRDKYLQLYKEMSQKIKELQRADGFWSPSLLDGASYPIGESSGTALFSYAIAWGVNNNIHPLEQYAETLSRAQNALLTSVESSGKVGWIQRPGSGPESVKKEDSHLYGIGAFLMAGVEMNKLPAFE